MSKILSQAQAEAVYSAMVALNNVSGRIEKTLIGRVVVTETHSGVVTVDDPDRDVSAAYDNQADFAAAYGLN